MTGTASFFIGLIIGAVLAVIAIVSGYGKDADDYYEGSKKDG